jgi:hypothetical protein
MTAMDSTGSPAGADRGERLVDALVPTAPVRHVPPAAPLPMLPILGLPSRTEPGELLLDMARLDPSGRLSARGLLAALGWDTGHRVDVAVVAGAIVIGSAATGLHAVGGRGELSLPAAARRMCGIAPGMPVLVVACPARDVLVVHPASLVAELLCRWYAEHGEGQHVG